MALTEAQWSIINDATEKMRAMGCAVCVFTPDDVEGASDEAAESAEDAADGDANATADEKPGMTAEQSLEWMFANRRGLEDAMSTCGNEYITNNL